MVVVARNLGKFGMPYPIDVFYSENVFYYYGNLFLFVM